MGRLCRDDAVAACAVAVTVVDPTQALVSTIHVENLVLALPRKHPLADVKKLELSNLQDEPAVLLAKPAETRYLIDRALGKAGVDLQSSINPAQVLASSTCNRSANLAISASRCSTPRVFR